MKKFTAFALIAGLACSSAWAQGDLKAARAMVFRNCAAEIQQFCPNVPRARGLTAKCLKKHSANLSPACKDALDNAIATFKQSHM